MNIMILGGIGVCIGCLFYGIPGLWSNIGIYIDPNSFVLVLGGTVGAPGIVGAPGVTGDTSAFFSVGLHIAHN